MRSQQFWTATRDREICFNLGYPELHSHRRDAREDLKGMADAGYPNLDLVHVTVMTAFDLAELRRQINVAVTALEEIEASGLTIRGLKSVVNTALIDMIPRREEIPETKKGRKT
jgi:hypothetical protein